MMIGSERTHQELRRARERAVMSKKESTKTHRNVKNYGKGVECLALRTLVGIILLTEAGMCSTEPTTTDRGWSEVYNATIGAVTETHIESGPPPKKIPGGFRKKDCVKIQGNDFPFIRAGSVKKAAAKCLEFLADEDKRLNDYLKKMRREIIPEDGDEGYEDGVWTSGFNVDAAFQWGDYVVWRDSRLFAVSWDTTKKEYFHGTVVLRTNHTFTAPEYTIANVVNGKIVTYKFKNEFGSTRKVVARYADRESSEASEIESSEASESESSEASESESSEASESGSCECDSRRRLSPLMHSLMDEIEEQK